MTIRAKMEEGGHRHTIYGLLVQARDAQHDASPMAYGTFSTSNEHLQTLTCFNKQNVGTQVMICTDTNPE